MGQSEKDLNEIDDLATFFGETTNKLGDLWRNIESGQYYQNEKPLFEELSIIQGTFPEKITKMSKLILSHSKKDDEMIQDKANDYLKRKFNR